VVLKLADQLPDWWWFTSSATALRPKSSMEVGVKLPLLLMNPKAVDGDVATLLVSEILCESAAHKPCSLQGGHP